MKFDELDPEITAAIAQARAEAPPLPPEPPAVAPVPDKAVTEMTDDELLDELKYHAFSWTWDDIDFDEEVFGCTLEEIKRRAQREARLQGWVPFGTHVDCILPADRGLEFSEELDETGLPEWERVVTT